MRISDWSSDVCSSDLFGGEIILFLLDAFAELETHIAGKRNKRTGFPARLRNDFRDRRLVVDYEKLAQKSIFLGELGNRPIHHFRNNLRWLAGFRSLFSGNRTLAPNQRLVNVFRIQGQRACRSRTEK